MHACEKLLCEVMECLKLEESALAREDMDALEDLAGRRKALQQQLWEERHGYDTGLLRLRLQEVLEAQDALAARAKDLQKKLRSQFSAGRKQAKYFDGDRHIQSQLQKAFYCDSVS